MTLRFTPVAERQLLNAVEAIAGFSKQGSAHFVDEVEARLSAVLQSPGRYPLDTQRDSNEDGSFRFFLVGYYRFSYQITPSEIVIVRCRHIKRAPLHY